MTDSSTPTSFDVVSGTTSAAQTTSSSPLAPSGDVTWVEGITLNSPVLELRELDDDNQPITYKFKETGNTTSVGGEFKIVDNRILVNTTELLVPTNVTFTYNIVASYKSSGQLAQAEGTVRITILDQDQASEAPIFVPDAAPLYETAAASTVIGRLYAGGDGTSSFRFVDSNGPTSSDGAFTIVGNEIRVNNSDKIEVTSGASRSFTYAVFSTDPASATSVSIIVNNVNKAPSAPTFNSLTTTLDEAVQNGTLIGALSATDPDGTTPSFVFSDTRTAFSADGAIEIVDGQVRVKDQTKLQVSPQEGQKIFNYAVLASDGSSTSPETTPADISITVSHVNRAPVAQTGSYSVIEKAAPGTVVAALAATDADGQVVTYTFENGTAVSADSRFKIDGNTILVNAMTSVETDETTVYQIVAKDNSGEPNDTATGAITITTRNENTAPTAIALSSASVRELSSSADWVGNLSAIDSPGDSLTYSLVGDGAGGRFNLVNNNGTWQLVVANGLLLDYEQAASHSVRVKATDQGGLSVEQDFTINVADWVGEKAVGSPGRDVLKGGLGNDKLYGDYGNDVLTGGAGKDVFVFNTKLGSYKTDRQVNFDTITDFNWKHDTIWLENSIFKKLGKKGSEKKPAKLDKDFFKLGTKATDKDDYLIYNKKAGILSYDVDGSGAKKAVEIARFDKKPVLKLSDFFVI